MQTRLATCLTFVLLSSCTSENNSNSAVSDDAGQLADVAVDATAMADATVEDTGHADAAVPDCDDYETQESCEAAGCYYKEVPVYCLQADQCVEDARLKGICFWWPEDAEPIGVGIGFERETDGLLYVFGSVYPEGDVWSSCGIGGQDGQCRCYGWEDPQQGSCW